MERYITDECTELRYGLVGDYYLIAGDKIPEVSPIGVWGERHRRYLRENKRDPLQTSILRRAERITYRNAVKTAHNRIAEIDRIIARLL